MRKHKGHLLAIVVVLGLAIAAGMPLFQGRFLSGHDALFYPARTVAFQAGLAEWRLLPRWSQQFGAGYGEPFFNFVPPFLCYLVVFLRLLGLGLANAQNYACFALLAGSGLGMYLLASSWFGKAGGLAAAAAYMYSPYMLLDLYVRGAYGELSALPFPPLIIWALYRLSETDKSRYFVAVALAYAALLLCNNPASLIFTPALVLFVLLQAWRKRNLRTLLNGSAALALGLILSAYFWLPAFVEK